MADIQASLIDEDFLIVLAELDKVKAELNKEKLLSSPPKSPISIEDKCQYEPCINKKLIVEGKKQLFCSNDCKLKWRKDNNL